MRLGELRHRARLFELNADLRPVDLGELWVGIHAKESADPPMAAGLRNPARIAIRARYSPKVTQGRYLRHGGRLFHITSARDPLGNRAELRITADELIGEPGLYRSQGEPPVPCRVFLTHSAPYLDELGQVVDYKTRAEVAVIEVGRPVEGDLLEVGGVCYQVIAYANGTDDGVVRGLWLERL